MSAKNKGRKLRIVYITKNFPPLHRVSGTQKYAEYLCVELGKKCDLTAIALDNLNGNEGGNPPCKTIRAGQPFPFKAAFAARKLKPDVVVFGSGFSSAVWLVPALLSMRLALGGTPLILHQLTEFSRRVPALMLKPACMAASKVVCTNKSLLEYFRNACGGKAEILLPGADLAIFSKIGKKNSGKIRAGFFGHFHELKGPDRLLAAFKKLRLENAEAVFDGADYEQGAMLRLLRKEAKNARGVAFIGESKGYVKLLSSCDFVVLPFRSGGSVLGVSMAAIEAMAAGKPVIGSDVSVLNSVIEGGKNGFIVSDDEQLAGALEALFTDSALRGKMGKNARKTALETLDIKIGAELFLRICEGAAKK